MYTKLQIGVVHYNKMYIWWWNLGRKCFCNQKLTFSDEISISSPRWVYVWPKACIINLINNWALKLVKYCFWQRFKPNKNFFRCWNIGSLVSHVKKLFKCKTLVFPYKKPCQMKKSLFSSFSKTFSKPNFCVLVFHIKNLLNAKTHIFMFPTSKTFFKI